MEQDTMIALAQQATAIAQLQSRIDELERRMYEHVQWASVAPQTQPPPPMPTPVWML
jgi:uncharacterized coiled-coil protein SlyX